MAVTDGLNQDVTLHDVLDAVYNDMGAEFKARIAPAFEEGELEAFGQALASYEPAMNDFMYSLINQIGMVNVNYNSFISPLKDFKKGFLEYGDTIEDIYIEPVKGFLYESEVPNDNPGDQWQTFKADIDVVYYTVNRDLVYPLTINRKQLMRAFRSYRELDKFLSGLMKQLTNADEIDDYTLTSQLLSNYADMDGKNLYKQVHVDAVTDEASAKGFIKAVRSIVPLMKFPSRAFNSKGVLNWCDPEDMYLIITPETRAIIDVDVLATSFHMEKAEFLGHVKEIPNLPANTVGLLVHKELIQDWDTFRQMASTGLNARHLTTNYFYHHQGIMALSPFYPAIQFTTATVTEPSAVAITGGDTITKGQTANYVATVTGGSIGAVEWEVVGNPQYVSINQNGNLTVGKKFAGESVTIKATSVEKATVTATKEVTVA